MNTIRKHKKLTGLTTTVAYAALALSSFPGGLTAAPALPTGGHVVSGNAAIHQNGPNGLQIDQSSRAAIINWGGFSIGEGGAVHFANGTGATLNRVTGGLPSRIDGSLTATGGVYLVNQAGVVVGKEGRIDTGGSFVASTHDVSDSAFLAGGDLLFSGNSDALVINAGQIGSLGGDVALIARRVENTGKLTAPQGAVALAAGYEVLARDAALSDGKFLVRIGGSGTAALNAGAIEAAAAELRANGGNVYALAGNTAGIIKATAVNQSGGRIIFDAGSTGAVELAGTIDASAQSGTGILPVSVASQSAPAPSGGLITATGQTITVKSGATLDASGATGGKILLGGDYQGGKNAASNFAPDGLTLATASATTVEAGSLLRADGLAGDGGNIVVWADHLTTYAGHLSAQALGLTGDGGFAEVSGKAVLDFTGTADLRAAHGATGLLLLDPYNVTISTGTDAGGGLGSDPTGTSVINRTTLQNALASANVLVTTGGAGSAGGQAGDIFVNADLEWSSGTTLELSAYRNITVNAVIDAGSGSVILRSDNSGTGDGTVIFPTGGNGHIIAIGGVKIYFNPKVNTDLDPSVRNNVNPYSYAAPTENFAANLATGTPYQGYMLVNTLYDLQNVDNNRTGARQGQGASASGRLGYALSRDIDASETWEWNSGNGFQHIGASGGSTYSAPVFDGQGHVISNLYMQRAGSSPVGLFGFISGSETVPVQIVNLGLVGGTISGGGQGTGSQALGGLVGGATNAVIQNSFVYGTKISGTSVYAIGGLLGYINGGVVIKDSFAIADLTLVSGSGNTQGYGGLVGGLYGSGNIIESSFFAGQLPASNSGALIGRANSGASATLTNLYWDTSTTTRPAIGTNTANLPVTGAIGLSHEDMAVAASFAGFDFTGAGPWSAPGSLSSFPVLKVFGDRDYNALLRFLPVTYSFGSPLSWEYGNDHDLALIHYDLDGLQGDDAATVRGILQLTNSSGARVTLSALTNAGTYTLSILGLVGEGAVAYRIADTGNTPGTLTITPAPLTITLVDLEKEYGTLIANPSAAAGAGDAWVASVTGLKNGEALSQLTVRSLGFEAAADGNAYAITGTGAAFLRGTGSVPASNYNITYVPGTLTVQNVPGGAINYVTYQFGSNYSWTYGQDDRGQITWSLRNPLNADVTDVTGVLVIKQGATEVTDLTRLNAGSYQLTIGSLAGENASNYTIDHAHSQPGSLTVNKASVHYVFGQPSYSWTYGQDDRSQITWTFKDANNEEIVVAGSLAIRSDSTDVTAQTVLSRGTYNLTVNSTDTNYQVDTSASIPATLTVNGIPLTVTLRDIFKGLDELTTWDEGQVGTRYIEGDLLSLFLQSVDGLLDGHTLNRIRTVISDSDTENVRTVDLYRVVSTGAFSSLTIRVVEADGTQIAWTDVYDLTLIPGSITFTDNPSTVKEVIYDFSGNAVTGWVYGSDNRGNITWTLKDSDNTVLTESGHQVAGVLAIKQGGTDVTAQTLLNAGTYELHIGSLTGANAGDYRIAATGNTPGSLTVSKALLTLKANDGLSKVYGDVFTFLGTEYAISAGQLYGTDAITGVTLTSDG
ncbi:filamentous hemagglutinin family N-terminal domain protein, partial [Opitutaceae bacterium TAV1]